MTARASAAEARTESDEQAGDYQHWKRANDAEVEGGGEEYPEQHPAGQQAREKTDAPERVASDGLEDAGQDTADAGDFAVEQQHRGRAQTDEHATEQ
jgi:hypothetical protein